MLSLKLLWLHWITWCYHWSFQYKSLIHFKFKRHVWDGLQENICLFWLIKTFISTTWVPLSHSVHVTLVICTIARILYWCLQEFISLCNKKSWVSQIDGRLTTATWGAWEEKEGLDCIRMIKSEVQCSHLENCQISNPYWQVIKCTHNSIFLRCKYGQCSSWMDVETLGEWRGIQINHHRAMPPNLASELQHWRPYPPTLAGAEIPSECRICQLVWLFFFLVKCSSRETLRENTFKTSFQRGKFLIRMQFSKIRTNHIWWLMQLLHFPWSIFWIDYIHIRVWGAALQKNPAMTFHMNLVECLFFGKGDQDSGIFEVHG